MVQVFPGAGPDGRPTPQDVSMCSGPFEPDCPIAHRSPEEYDRIHATGIMGVVTAAGEVIARWANGDLAEATNALTGALGAMRGPLESALDHHIAGNAGIPICRATEMLRQLLAFRCRCDDEDPGPDECPVHDDHTSLEDAHDDLYQLLMDAERELLRIDAATIGVHSRLGLTRKLYESRLSDCERRHADHPAAEAN